ncbi:MAG TPA: hypothetical protein PKI78_11525 [Anaerolineales bacterium]|nr:hypothetical protein [Anaerolineales bacterium]
MMNTDDLRHYTGIGTGYSPEVMMQRAADEIDNLRALAIACRSSVKFDLLHYEKMARAYGNLGREGEQTAATAEAEAQRLHTLLEKIDALALTTPNVEVTGAARLHRAASGGPPCYVS